MAHDAASRAARARFQSGLLAWLRQPDDPAGLREMIAVLRDLAAHAGPAADGILWRSAEAFLAALLDGTARSDDRARQMCRRIERHLAVQARNATAPVDPELRDALFSFLSGKTEGAPAGDSPAAVLSGLSKAMGNSLARTAEILPLIAGAMPPRYSAEHVAAWRSAAQALDAAWHALVRGQRADCRAPATALVAVALAINTAACLQLAEALAAACADAEEPMAREHPVRRAAIAAALEIAADRDGPNQAHFEPRTAHCVARLKRAEDEFRAASGNLSRVADGATSAAPPARGVE